jgi:hypothetical protein
VPLARRGRSRALASPGYQLCLSQFSTGGPLDRDRGVRKGGGGRGVSPWFSFGHDAHARTVPVMPISEAE